MFQTLKKQLQFLVVLLQLQELLNKMEKLTFLIHLMWRRPVVLH